MSVSPWNMYATLWRKSGALGSEAQYLFSATAESSTDLRNSEMEQSAQSERRAIEQEVGEPDLGTSRRDAVSTHPQPTQDPLDPLNWTWRRKHAILSIVMFMYDCNLNKKVTRRSD